VLVPRIGRITGIAMLGHHSSVAQRNDAHRAETTTPA
jgi:hypothetical protein